MAFVKSIRSTLLGLGHATTYVKREAVSATATSHDVLLPASGSFAPTISSGKIRVKAATIGASATFIVSGITGTDGSTTVMLYGGDTAASAAGIGIDHTYAFATDLSLTSITVSIVVGANTSTLDYEVAGHS